MRSWFWQGTLAAAIVLPALSNAAWANDGCSDATLHGEYAFGATLYTPQNFPNGPPAVVTGIKIFDGKGNLIQHDYRGDSGDVAFGTEDGTYSVDPDCTGTMTIHEVPGVVEIDLKIVISNGGNHIHEVVSTLTVGGNAVHPTQTSADDWKVVPEENRQ
jgi:hypothetical protein